MQSITRRALRSSRIGVRRAGEALAVILWLWFSFAAVKATQAHLTRTGVRGVVAAVVTLAVALVGLGYIATYRSGGD